MRIIFAVPTGNIEWDRFVLRIFKGPSLSILKCSSLENATVYVICYPDDEKNSDQGNSSSFGKLQNLIIRERETRPYDGERFSFLESRCTTLMYSGRLWGIRSFRANDLVKHAANSFRFVLGEGAHINCFK